MKNRWRNMFLICDQADTWDESEGDERGGRRQIGLRFLQSYMLAVTSPCAI